MIYVNDYFLRTVGTFDSVVLNLNFKMHPSWGNFSFLSSPVGAGMQSCVGTSLLKHLPAPSLY